MTSTTLRACAAALLAGCIPASGMAQTAPRQSPQQAPRESSGPPSNAPNSVTPTTLAFAPLAYDEDYTRYADPTIRDTPWERLKYIPMSGDGYVSLGGELRPRVEYLDDLNFGRGPQSKGFDVQLRTRLWADVHATPWLRVFGEIQSGLTEGLDFPAIAIDNNPLELHQAFIELSQPIGPKGRAFLRVGRQEIAFGKSRIIDTRGAPNTRRSFQAARAQVTTGAWRFGAWAGRPLRDTVGVLNDAWDTRYDVYSAHVARKVGPLLPGSELELLYVHTDRIGTAAVFNGRRDTISLRLAGKEGLLDYDIEGVRQTGRAADGRTVDAWFVGLDAAYQLPGAWKPRIGVRADLASGDKNPTDGKVGTYDLLFARGMTFTPELGYPNLISVGPSVGVKPSAKLSTELAVQPLWRTTVNDGIYNMAPALVRRGDEGTSRYVGTRMTTRVEYQWNRFLATGIYANRTFAGAYLKETGDGKSLFYSTLYAVFRF